MAFERSSSADIADSRREYRSMTVCATEFSKDLCKNNYTKMNCWKNVADKLYMSPEDTEKQVKDIRLCFLNDHSDHMEIG